MTGQIPPYGKYFRRESQPYDHALAGTRYVLKTDDAYWLRADKTSKVWWLFCAGQAFAWRGSMTAAMQLMTSVADRAMRFPGTE